MKRLLIIGLMALLAACGTSRSTQVRNLQLGDGIGSMASKSIKADYYEAMKQKLIGNDEKAIELFKKVIKSEPDLAAAYYEIAGIYRDRNDFQEAAYYAEKAAHLDPENGFYQILYAEILAYFQKYDEAAALLEKLVEKNPRDRTLMARLAMIYEVKGDFEKAIDVYNRLEKVTGPDEGIMQAKKTLYLRINDVDGAASEIKKMIEANPGEMRYRLMLAELYSANNRPEDAKKAYREILRTDPENAQAAYALANYALADGQQEEFDRLIEKAFRSPQLDPLIKSQFAYGYLQRYGQTPEGRQKALQLADWMVESNSESGLAWASKAQILQLTGHKKEALETYKKALQLEESNFKIWQDALFVALELEDRESLLKLSNEALTVFPNQPLIWFMKGMAYLMGKDYDQAKEVFEQALLVSAGNPTMEAEIYARLGDIYHEKGMDAQSDSLYDKSLELNPDNPLLLNNYAYYLSLRGEKLDRAERMAARANELQPRDPNFEDTYAWILYKKGKYKDAAMWLERAINHGGAKNGVILEHYGDVLYRLGQKEKAIEYWRKARQAGGGSDLLEKKIEEGVLHE